MAPNAIIAPYGDMLDPAPGAIYSLLEGEAPNRRLTVAWIDVGRNCVSNCNGLTFQTTLHETGEIVFNYLDAEIGPPASDANKDFGGYAVVGIEDHTGTLGELFSYHEPALKNQFSLLFSPAPKPVAEQHS